MKIYSLHYEIKIDRPLQEVFTFFSRPENLARITPPSLGFVILTPQPIEMREGTRIQYSIRLLGIRAGWTSLITGYDPPHRFVDEQVHGPYSSWRHTHSFKETQDSTLVMDDVQYAVPFGYIGRFIHLLFIRRQLEKIFSYRAEVLAQVLHHGQTTAC
jgi:ligand-binding SRPBCC domain-containing protein